MSDRSSWYAACLFLRTERTYCFTAVRDQTRRLLKRLLEVVFEPLVLVFFGSQLHEFPCHGEHVASRWTVFFFFFRNQ